MELEELIAEYEEYCKSIYSHSSVLANVRVARKIIDYSNGIKKSIQNFEPNDAVDYIRSCNPYGNRGIRWVKTTSNNFLRWLKIKGIDCDQTIESIENIRKTDIICSDNFAKWYFKSSKDIKSKLDLYIKNICLNESTHESVYDTTKAILYLAWAGGELTDIANIKLNDINRGKGTLLLPYTQKEKVVDEDIFEFIDTYSKASFFYKKGKKANGDYLKFSYKPSQYLIRTTKSEHLSNAAIMNMVSRFNDIDNNWPQEFLIKKIRLSGIFSRAYKMQFEIGLLDFDRNKRKSFTEEELILYSILFETPFNSKRTSLDKLYDMIVQYQNYKLFFYG